MDEETGKLVIVAINDSAEEQAVELAVPHRARKLTLTPHRTAEGEALAEGAAVRLDRDADGTVRGTAVLAPRSITTYTAPWA